MTDGAVPAAEITDASSTETIDSGPFCRHWDGEQCRQVCSRCQHRCGAHDIVDPGDCCECECLGWVE